MVTAFHLPERALALHLLLQRLESLVDIIVAHINLNDGLVLLTDAQTRQRDAVCYTSPKTPYVMVKGR